jgi:hypothetical protein
MKKGAWRLFRIYVPICSAYGQIAGPLHLLRQTTKKDAHRTIKYDSRLFSCLSHI